MLLILFFGGFDSLTLLSLGITACYIFYFIFCHCKGLFILNTSMVLIEIKLKVIIE